MIAFEIPAESVPFARAGSNGSRRFTPAPQAAFMRAVGLYASRAMAGAAPLTGPVKVCIRATYEWPTSWSAKRRAGARWKDTKPDADNAAKLLCDAMNKIVYADDAQISSLTVQKVYGEAARVVVSVQSLEVAP